MAGLNTRTLLSALILLQSATAVLCDGIYGSTSPQTDVFLAVGQSLELNCTVHIRPTATTTTTLSPGHTTDQLANISARDPGTTLSVYNISMTNGGASLPESLFTYHEAELTLQLNVDNVTKEDDGMYFCKYMYDGANKIMAMKRVQVGEPPAKPTNLTCISDNFLNMTCHVTLREQNGTIPFVWQLEYKTDSRDKWTIFTDPCPGQKCRFTSRAERRTNFTFQALAPYYDVRVIVENKLARVSSETLSFEPWDIVKPAVVKYLQVEVVNSSLAVATWMYPDLLDPNNNDTILEYEIAVEAEQGWDSRKLSFLHTAGVRQEQLSLPGLVCNAGYRLAVRSRPERADSDIYWSSWSNTTFTTTQDRPEQSTEMPAGSFHVLEKGNQVGVVLYWKNPPRQYQCGNIVGYLVEWTQISSGGGDAGYVTIETTPQRISDSSTVAYTAFQNSEQSSIGKEKILGAREYQVLDSTFSGGEGYELSMYVVNSVGQSQQSSQLVLPSWQQARHVRASWVSVEMFQGRAHVAWAMAGRQHCPLVGNVTYYWCAPNLDKGLNQSYVSCKDQFAWEQETVEDACGSNHFWINMTGVDLSAMRFAVSVSTVAGMTGGMVWEKYRFKTYDAVPATPQLSLAAGQTSHRELHVSLLYSDYYNVEEGGRPDNLQLVYMVATDTIHTCQQVNASHGAMHQTSSVDLDQLGLTLRSLKPDTRYAVCARFANRFGSGGFAKMETIKTGAEKTSQVWIPVVFGVLGLTLIAAAILPCYRRIRERVSRNRKVFVPEIASPQDTIARYTPTGSVAHLTLITETKTQKPSGHDSGKGSDSPGSSYSIDTKETDGDGHYQEVDIKESTPILARSTNVLASCSSSGLSGYLKVSNYGQSASEEDLLSCLEDDEDISGGESNASFSHAHEEGSFMGLEKRPKIYHRITLDDISMKQNSDSEEGAVCGNEDEMNVEENASDKGNTYTAGDFHIEGALPRSVTGVSELPTSVGNSDTTVTDLTNGVYCSDAVVAITGLAHGRPKQGGISSKELKTPEMPSSSKAVQGTGSMANEDPRTPETPSSSQHLNVLTNSLAGSPEEFVNHTNDATVDHDVELPADSYKASEYSQATMVEPNSADHASAKLDGEDNDEIVEFKSETLTCESNNTHNQNYPDLSPGNTNVEIAEGTLEESLQTDTNDMFISTDPNEETVDLFQDELDTETDMLANQYISENFAMSNYQNPDSMSLGQGSILSFISDSSRDDSRSIRSREDSRSIRSVTSPERTPVMIHRPIPETQTSVLNMCNEINSQFVPQDTADPVSFEKKSIKDKAKGEDVSEPNVGRLKDDAKGTDISGTDVGRLISGGDGVSKESCRERSKAESVKDDGGSNCNSGDQGVNSYVRAAVQHS